MKRIPFILTMLVLSTAIAVVGQEKNSKLEAELIKMDKDWTAAELRGDKTAASAFVADDYWATNPDGKVVNRAQYLEALAASTDTDVADDYSVRFFGDVAVMTHRGTVTGDRNYQYRSTHVWVKRNGKWQLIAHQSGEIGAQPAKP